MVRTLLPPQFRSAWMFVKKGEKGQRKIGPMVYEKHKWPGRNREFPELSPKFQQNNRPELRGYTGVQNIGFTDQETGQFVRVPEMGQEIVVPDLSNFSLEPYVSYRTDVEIRKRELKYEQLLVIHGSHEKAIENAKQDDEIWPPPPTTPKFLFDYFYENKIREDYGQEQRPKKKRISRSVNLIDKLNIMKILKK